MGSLGIISLRLLVTVAITVSSDQKKENSPLPAAVAACLVVCLVVAKFGSDSRSHSVAVLFWLCAGRVSCAGKG